MRTRATTVMTALAAVIALAVGLVACGGSDEVVQPDPLSHIPIFDDPDPEVVFAEQGDTSAGTDDPFCVAVREHDAAGGTADSVSSDSNFRRSFDENLASIRAIRTVAPNEEVAAALDVTIGALSTITALDLPTDVHQLMREDPSGDRLAAIIAEVYITMLDPDVMAAAGTFGAHLNAACGYALPAVPTELLTREELAQLRGMSLDQLGQALGR